MRKWLYHAKHKAKIVETDEVDMDELCEGGWKERPVLQVSQDEGRPGDEAIPSSINLTMDQTYDLVENGIIETDEGIEIIVTDFSPAQTLVPVTEERDSESVGNEEPSLADGVDSLLVRFNEYPHGLTKDEHVILGKNLGIKTMISSWSEKTLIAKIQEQLGNGNNEATD